MFIWDDLFRWSKVVYLPDWINALPAPIMAPSYMTFVCLLPAGFVTASLANARAAVVRCVLLAPLLPIITYTLEPLHHNRFLIANALFHYAWIVLFFSALPALLVILIRAAIEHARKPKHG